MKKIEGLLKKIDKKKVSFLLTLTLIFSSVINLQTKHKLENGYEFFLSFLSVISNTFAFIFLCSFKMLRWKKNLRSLFI